MEFLILSSNAEHLTFHASCLSGWYNAPCSSAMFSAIINLSTLFLQINTN
uniref:Uncharacterized protein n=1 Tax=Arundo donax TaxID=35708 RepID=A0A0A9FHR8_ARUDO